MEIGALSVHFNILPKIGVQEVAMMFSFSNILANV